MADAPDSKSGARKGVEVQVLSPVLFFRARNGQSGTVAAESRVFHGPLSVAIGGKSLLVAFDRRCN
jgi:hypothetical protein